MLLDRHALGQRAVAGQLLARRGDGRLGGAGRGLGGGQLGARGRQLGLGVVRLLGGDGARAGQLLAPARIVLRAGHLGLGTLDVGLGARGVGLA